MKLKFPIDRIDFDFEMHGDCDITIKINGKNVPGKVIHGNLLKGQNVLSFDFYKSSPDDTDSYAILSRFDINGGDFLDEIKLIPYHVDKTQHPEAHDLANNLYFGYIGTMEVLLEQPTDNLSKAGWLIAHNNFENPKENTRGNPYREKNFKEIHEDYKYIFNGCTAPKDRDITSFVHKLTIGDIKDPIDFQQARQNVERWMATSDHMKLRNLDKFGAFNHSGGTVNCLESFISRCKENVYLAPKYYYFIGEICQGQGVGIRNAFDGIEQKSHVLFEFPSPWYDNETIISKIKEAKDKDCYIGLDLTWAPVATRAFDLDLSIVDEVYFSMNKAWPISEIRPAWRWTKQMINDAIGIQHDWNYYHKIQPNIFFKLIEKFDVDHTKNKYQQNINDICKKFDLEPTEVLWFTRHESTANNEKGYINQHYFLDDFVCIRKLLDHKDEYFW